MKKFDIRKELNLGFLGDAWKECKLVLRPVSIQELSQIVAEGRKIEKDVKDAAELSSQNVERMLRVITEHFVEGTGIVEGKIEKLAAEDLKALPVQVTSKAFDVVAGNVDPNSQKPSTT